MLPIVDQVKAQLAEGRASLQKDHESGLPGRLITSRFADLADTVLIQLVHDALDAATDGNRAALESKIALVPHGGYGRRDLAPFSDLDLMLLYRQDAVSTVEEFAARLSRNIVDVGFDLGFSTRTPAEAVSLALKDVRIFTSLVESRYLAGSVGIYSKFLSRLARQAQRRPQGLVRAIENARFEERKKNGDTAFLLRPNIKKTRGGLRDIQLIRWLGFIKFGKSDMDALLKVKAINEADHRNVSAAYRFLLRLRNEMHFQAGRARDVLGMNEQVRIAEAWGYQPELGVLPVERFMRDYFDHTDQVAHAADHAVASAKSRFYFSDLFAPLFSQPEEGYFRVGPLRISTTRKGLDYVRGDLEGVLHLMSLANLHRKHIDHATWQDIRTSMMTSENFTLSSTSAWRFCTFMSDNGRLGDLLRRLHEMRVLEKIIPAFKHARCLVQFNEYHKYTVDEHSIRAVEAATHYAERKDILGRCYNSIKDKKILHLALLLHDVGKGFDEDHSVVGARLARETGQLLNLSHEELDDLEFLVRHHLMMAHLAFRRDTTDESLVATFAADVGSTDILKMLFVLTCADLEAVGPDTLTQWKLNLVSQLYYRSLRQLSGHSAEDAAEYEHENARRSLVEELVESGKEQLATLAQNLPPDLFDEWSRDDVIDLIEALSGLEDDAVVIRANRMLETTSYEYLIGKLDRPYSAVFHRITGALTSERLKILSVETSRPQPPIVIYRFKVADREARTEPQSNGSKSAVDQRVQFVCSKIDEALRGSEVKPRFRKVWGESEGPSTEEARLSTRIQVDNKSVNHATIIDVFTHDRTGLLYTITETLHDLELQITAAKIGTYLDQVVDVFYVTGVDGKKIRDSKRIEKIKAALLDSVEQAVRCGE